MYQNTPYKNFLQIREALQKKEAVLRIAKGKYAVLLEQFGKGRISVVLTFLLQLILPTVFVTAWYFSCRELTVFAALPVYLILPFVFPLNQFLAVGMTAFGLFGLIWHWPAWAVALLLPALLSYFGGWVWQQNILILVCRQALRDQKSFEELWRQGVIALQDREGIYQYTASERNNV